MIRIILYNIAVPSVWFIYCLQLHIFKHHQTIFVRLGGPTIIHIGKQHGIIECGNIVELHLYGSWLSGLPFVYLY